MSVMIIGRYGMLCVKFNWETSLLKLRDDLTQNSSVGRAGDCSVNSLSNGSPQVIGSIPIFEIFYKIVRQSYKITAKE